MFFSTGTLLHIELNSAHQTSEKALHVSVYIQETLPFGPMEVVNCRMH